MRRKTQTILKPKYHQVSLFSTCKQTHRREGFINRQQPQMIFPSTTTEYLFSWVMWIIRIAWNWQLCLLQVLLMRIRNAAMCQHWHKSRKGDRLQVNKEANRILNVKTLKTHFVWPEDCTFLNILSRTSACKSCRNMSKTKLAQPSEMRDNNEYF